MRWGRGRVMFACHGRVLSFIALRLRIPFGVRIEDGCVGRRDEVAGNVAEWFDPSSGWLSDSARPKAFGYSVSPCPCTLRHRTVAKHASVVFLDMLWGLSRPVKAFSDPHLCVCWFDSTFQSISLFVPEDIVISRTSVVPVAENNAQCRKLNISR